MKFQRDEIDLRLKTPAIEAPIDLKWRTVDAYQRAFKTKTCAGCTKGRSLILA